MYNVHMIYISLYMSTQQYSIGNLAIFTNPNVDITTKFKKGQICECLDLGVTRKIFDLIFG